MIHTNEQAVAGTTTGLINESETVTWKAKHLFKTRVLRVKITAMQQPFSFTDEMLDGDFKSMKHEHHFKKTQNGTFMIDLLNYSTPFGGIGWILDKYYLANYMKKLIEQRNAVIKEYAETDKWKFILE